MNTDYFSFTFSECQIAEHAENIAVRSGCHTERRARRARAAKATTGVISLKSGLSGRKKCSTLQEVDYSDPLQYLRGTTNVSKLLTAAEEIRLSEGIQDLLKTRKAMRDSCKAKWLSTKLCAMGFSCWN